jgi:hypothetical protein
MQCSRRPALVDDIGTTSKGENVDTYPPIEGLPTDVETYERYEVYVDSGRADDLFQAFCSSLGRSIETSWKDTEYV